MTVRLPPGIDYDEDALFASLDLIGRTGAAWFRLGWLHDDRPVEEMGWYAHVQYKGARITAEDQPGPVQAVVTLARRLLTGARCARCRRLVALSDLGAFAYGSSVTVDGVRWSARDAAAAGQCRWTLTGRRWDSACAQTGGS
jgi:hypothetical protein